MSNIKKGPLNPIEIDKNKRRRMTKVVRVMTLYTNQGGLLYNGYAKSCFGKT